MVSTSEGDSMLVHHVDEQWALVYVQTWRYRMGEGERETDSLLISVDQQCH